MLVVPSWWSCTPRPLLDMKAPLAEPRAPGQQLGQLEQLGQLGIACGGAQFGKGSGPRSSQRLGAQAVRLETRETNSVEKVTPLKLRENIHRTSYGPLLMDTTSWRQPRLVGSVPTRAATINNSP